MKKIILFTFLYVVTGIANGQQWQWAHGSNTPNYDYLNSANCVVTDSQGNAYVAGYLGANSTIGNQFYTTPGGFFAKYDPSGNIVWIIHKGGVVAIDANDNLYLSGAFFGTITFGTATFNSNDGSFYLVKYDTDGNVIWAVQGGAPANNFNSSDVTAITTDNNGDIYITGTVYGAADFSGNTIGGLLANTTFFARYNSSGIITLLKAVNVNYTQPRSIAVDNTNNIIVAGAFAETAYFDGVSISSDSTGDYTNRDIFIVKYDSQGTLLWVNEAGGTWDEESATDIITDDFGNVYMTGQCGDLAVFDTYTSTGVGSYYVFWSKYNATGDLLWVKTPQQSSESFSQQMTFDDAGDLYLTFGASWGNLGQEFVADGSSSSEFICVMKTDTAGNVLWLKDAYAGQMGGHCCGMSHDLAYSNGNIYVVGSFQDSAAFDNISISGTGYFSAFVAKLVVECSANFTLEPDTALYHYNAVNLSDGIQPVNYTWDWGDGTYDYTAYPSHVYADTGSYTICLFIEDANGCTDTLCSDLVFKTDAQMVYINVYPPNTLSLNEEAVDATGLFIYPNPANDILTIETLTTNGIYQLFDITGKTLLQGTAITRKFTLDITSLSSGVYFISFSDGERQVNGKVVKE